MILMSIVVGGGSSVVYHLMVEIQTARNRQTIFVLKYSRIFHACLRFSNTPRLSTSTWYV